jgi:NADPH:quinone reductase-like Zn-dependent oxidoreductase
MRAVVQERWGGPETLRLSEVERPVAAAGEVLVRVRAVGLNAYDKYTMRGQPAFLRLLGMGLRGPKQRIRGIDFAGSVDSVGPGVTGIPVGREVFGHAGASLAEFTTASPELVLAKPSRLSFEQAAALSTAGVTALRGLRDNGSVKPGSRALINGAGGGVGTFAVQIAKALGAHVTGVTGPATAELVRALGADVIIDYSKVDFLGLAERFDVVLDISGNRPFGATRRLLAPGGKLVMVGGGNDGRERHRAPLGRFLKAFLLRRFSHGQLVICSASPKAPDFATLKAMVDAGTLTPVIDRTYPLEATAEAMRYLETTHVRGKLVVTVN